MAKSKADQRIDELENKVASLELLCQQLTERIRDSRSAKFWYEGGTLHNVTLKDWNYASKENKLASTADYIHAFIKLTDEYDANIDYAKDPNILLTAYCVPLMTCMDAVAAGPDAHELMEMPIAWIASACAHQLGFVRRNAIVEEANRAKNNEVLKRVEKIMEENKDA